MTKIGAVACLVLLAACGNEPSGVAPTATPAATGIALNPTHWIAYGHCVICDGSDDQVWLAHPDGSRNHSITTQLAAAYQADFSHDGTRITYDGDTANPDEPTRNYVASADGSDAHVAATCEHPICLRQAHPSWSPDGTRLAMSVYVGPPKNDQPVAQGIAVLDVASGKVMPVTMHSVSPDTSGQTLPQDPAQMFYDRFGEDRSPRWSPDGRFLVFFRTRLSADGTNPETAVFIVASDGEGLHQLTPWDELAGDPDWSPDGSLIVYDTRSKLIFDQGESELMTIRPDGTDRTVLTKFGAGGPRANHPRWTPDGKAILYMRTTGSGQATIVHVWVMGRSGDHDAPVLTAQQIMGDPALQP